MARALITLVLALLFTDALAFPTRSIRKRSFKVPRVEQKNYVPNGRAAVRRAYLKFGLGDIGCKEGGDAAARIRQASNTTTIAAGTENGETPAVGTQNDAQFLSPVTVGGQKMILNFDTGSSDMWIFNTNLPAKSQKGHTIYDPKKSSASKVFSGASFNISYGDGSASSGPVGYDVVDIGGSTVEQQAIGLPNVVSASFVSNSASNGLVGLAFSKLNTIRPEPQKTFFANVVNDLTLPVFTAQLKGGTVGAYEFGIIDETAFSGNLTTVPVDSSRGFWEFDSQKVVVNGKTTAITNGKAIADTGTSLMLVPEQMLTAYWTQVQGAVSSTEAGGIIFPCNAKLPDLQVAVGPTYMATVPGAFMNFANVGQDTTGQDFCFGGLQSNGNLGFAIYGDVWFKSQFVAFQATGPSLGIAPHS